MLTLTNHKGLQDWQKDKVQLPCGEEARERGDDSFGMADC
jgi:hypothetical protein